MSVYPLVSALVTAWFAGRVWRQYVQRRRMHQLIWALSLTMACGGSAAYAGSIALGGHAALFKAYYILGALLMAAYLGVGSVYLSFPGRVGHLCLIAVTVIGVIGAYLLVMAPVDEAALANLAGGSGRGLLQLSPLGRVLVVVMNTFGTIAVVGLAIYSAINLLRRKVAALWAAGNLTLAAGVLVIAAAGGAAVSGDQDSLFWPVMTVGWLITYGGFALIDSRRAQPHHLPASSD